ncbi:DUF4337 family protein, partial [Enterobacter hormaechei]|uniref:DUF4337 family protein n=1 Tax=Enterobacter hormaechei TaxID=158836 RepID=UPI0013D658E7
YYQAKGIKGEIKKLQANSGMVDPSAANKYAKEQEEIKKTAEEEEHSSVRHLEKHVTLARSVTLFQIAIAISAIAILMKRKSLWV